MLVIDGRPIESMVFTPLADASGKDNVFIYAEYPIIPTKE